MVNAKSISQQLRKIGCDYALWGRSEIRELTHILMEKEEITQAVNGYYDGGFALLCITNYRVLIVDKKPLALTVEDLRYDMIAEVDFSARIFTAVLHIYTPMRTLVFTSWSMGRLRRGMGYVQERVMDLRSHDMLTTQFMQQQVATNAHGARAVRRSARRFIESQQVLPKAAMYGAMGGTDTRDPYTIPLKPFTNPYSRIPLMSRRSRYPRFYA